MEEVGGVEEEGFNVAVGAKGPLGGRKAALRG